jgi:glycosyltransferase involved in cell wall biosynthesis
MSGVPARWPMRVGELDVACPIAPIAGCVGHAAVRILARHRDRPLGWLTIAPAGDVASPEAIRRALVAQLGVDMLCAPPSEASEIDPTALPPISVVVCTRDRAASLETCVRALRALDYPRFEVVVVDNAPSTDAAREVAERLGVRYVREDRPGLDWARNRGIAEARHGLIAFTDDDVRVDARWLRGIARAFADPDVGAVTGLVAPMELATRAQVLFELHYGGMGKGVRPRTWDPEALPATVAIAAQHVGVGANMAFRREMLAAVGGFDVALDVGTPAHGAGDLERFHRALVAGVVVRYEPTALVWHRHRRDMPALRRQLYDNGRSFGVYLITIWRRGAVPRRTIAYYALGVWGRWLVARLARRALGREPLPASLLWAELWGATHAPWAFFRTQMGARATAATIGTQSSPVRACGAD